MSDFPNAHLASEELERVGQPDAETRLRNAEDLKAEGNDHFRASRWNEALVSYLSGLGQLPKRKPVSKLATSEEHSDEEQTDEERDKESVDLDRLKDEEISESDIAYAKARAVLNANISACYLKLGEHKHVVESCTEALRDDPAYIKALQRRASSNEILNTWSSLTSAQEDYHTLLKTIPEISPQRLEIQRNISRLAPRIEVAQKAETAEMLGKLKGLGNSILGNFGLSTDNFQFTPNGQGGYSMNFNR